MAASAAAQNEEGHTKNQADRPCWFLDLPNELIVHVASFGDQKTFRMMCTRVAKLLQPRAVSKQMCGITETNIKPLASMVAGNRSLHKLMLAGNRLGLCGVNLLCSALQKNPMVTSLDVSFNRLGLEEALALALGLARTNIRRLDLSGNAFCADRSGEISPFIRALHECPQLKVLILEMCRLTDDDIDGIASLFKTLEGLDLAENRIGEAGFVKVAGALPGSALLSLNMRRAYAGTGGGIALASALPLSSITALDIADCSIDHWGAAALALALSKMGLQKLDMTWNSMGDAKDAVAALIPKEAHKMVEDHGIYFRVPSAPQIM